MSNDIQIATDLPAPEPDKATVFGTLINKVNKEPVSGSPFLGSALTTNNPELPITVSFSLQKDPGAVFDVNTGYFYFENIEPGSKYVLVLVYGPGNFLTVEDPLTQLPLIISVNAGETIDLGTLMVTE